jgi:fucose 4-O-acetylase-like acetyltransferase
MLIFVFDIGLAVLRPILSFLVIMTHCYKLKSKKGLWKSISKRTKRFFFHVPIFFLMSFYFSQRSLSSSKYTKIFERFERLCMPYFLWPIIIYYLNKLLIKFSITNDVLELKDLRFQLTFGTGRMNMFAFWYQWDLIFITICFHIIIFMFEKKYTNLCFHINFYYIIYLSI